ncbi:MAG: hypothetical protein JWN86_799 [Planctomycetota bacterium]|nr:hypothetical protein [Planctomycetota bacterium]
MSDSPTNRRSLAAGLALGAILAAGAWADWSRGWVGPVFHAIGQLFYEKSALAELREPSQIALFRVHLLVLGGIVMLGLLASPRLSRHGRLWWAIFAVAYAIRAAIWIAGSNLPLVPGDSCHYVEIATSIYHGEGPVKHYVESFFTDYRKWILQGRGILDDWATPLFGYLLAAAYRLTGVVPGDSLEATFAVSKGLSFVLNLVTLPVLYLFARRRFGPEIALAAMAFLAILPVHAIYSGFELRESLVTLMSVLAVWTITEVWAADGKARYGWAVASGLCTGLAILSRNTAMALAAAVGLYGLIAVGRKSLVPMMLWGVVTAAVLVPWGAATFWEFGRPFHTYTNYFPYNFSWAVHHYAKGNTLASQFYTWPNAPAIVRVKIKAFLIILLYSTMIVSLPLMLAFLRRVFRSRQDDPGRHADRAVAAIGVAFVLGTIANVADVTQVAQLGRYYVPLFVLMIPSAVAGLSGWIVDRGVAKIRPILIASLVALLWADPSWAFDYSWLSRSYQLHWPALREAGDWVRSHPEAVPKNARIMTWFPWEFRLASRRTTILMNRSYYPPHIEETMRRYGVSHVLWGSFEPPPDIDPGLWGTNLTRLRVNLGLVGNRELYRSAEMGPTGTYPVTLYRVSGGP